MKQYFQRGGAAPLMLLLITGGLIAAAYATDASRMKSNAAQLKRATDAAALAVSQAHARDASIDVPSMALRYVQSNLGLDARELEQALSVRTEPVETDEGKGYRVHAQFRASAFLPGSSAQNVTVHSAAIARYAPLEVALALPNTGAENAANLAVLRRLGKRFAEKLVKDRKDAWLALVPYSQSVNVSPDYTDPTTRAPQGPGSEHRQRLNSWNTSTAIRPVELTSLFRSGAASTLRDPRIPDRRANLLCMYRGLDRGQNYFWDRPPTGQFQIYYRHDLIENGSPGAEPISWIGPNPMFGQATGVDDTRWMVADRGCPSAPLLPLTNNMSKIEERLGQMSTRFNTNYAIAMGWSAMALAPAFRGGNGWNLPDELPKNFRDDGGKSYKAIVMLVNTTDQRWFDSDGYNAYVGQPIDGQGAGAGGEKIDLRTQRLAQLCDSFRARKLRFFMIAIGQDEIPNDDLGAEGNVNGASVFKNVAGPGLARCAEKSGDITYLPGYDFAAADGEIESRMDKIIDDILQQGSFARLIE